MAFALYMWKLFQKIQIVRTFGISRFSLVIYSFIAFFLNEAVNDTDFCFKRGHCLPAAKIFVRLMWPYPLKAGLGYSEIKEKAAGAGRLHRMAKVH